MSTKTLSILKIFGWTMLLAILIGTIIVTGVYIRNNNQVAQQEQQTTQDIAAARGLLETQLDSLLTDITSEEDQGNDQQQAKVATLESVRDRGNEFAIAVTSFSSVEDTFRVDIIAQLSDPQPNSEYIAELTSGNSTLTAGTLTKETENTFILELETSENVLAFDQISIREQGNSSEIVATGELLENE